MEARQVEHRHLEKRYVPAGVPREVAGPASVIFLLGLWVFFVPLVGPYFGFGFHTDATWVFSERHWALSLAPGLVAAAAGLLMLVPNRVASSFWILTATLAGAWLVVGPSLYPLWSPVGIEPIAASETTSALLWIGYFYGPGGLILYLFGLAHGLLTRIARTEVVVEDVEEMAPEERTVVVG